MLAAFQSKNIIGELVTVFLTYFCCCYLMEYKETNFSDLQTTIYITADFTCLPATQERIYYQLLKAAFKKQHFLKPIMNKSSVGTNILHIMSMNKQVNT